MARPAEGGQGGRRGGGDTMSAADAPRCECCSDTGHLVGLSTEPSPGQLYTDTIYYCFSIQISHSSDKYICNVCIEKLSKAFEFKSSILQTQELLSKKKEYIECETGSDYQTFEDCNDTNIEDENKPTHDFNEDTSIKETHKKNKGSKSRKKLKSMTKDPTQLKPNQRRNLPYKIDRISLTCQICNIKFLQFKELQNHMPIHYPSYICHVCGRLFPNEFHLKIHQKSHQEKHLKCDHCDQMFKTKGTMQQHVNIIHLGLKKKFKCFNCDECFATYYLRVKHMIDSHGMEGKRFNCQMCPKQFHIANHMQEHIRKQHLNDRPFCCDKCPYKGYTNWALKQHYVTHTGEKKYRCEVCSKTYGRRNTLQEHMKMHALLH